MNDVEQLADALWDANCCVPESEAVESRAHRAWRRHGYGRVERACRSRIQSHRNPEPWLSIKCGLQALSGHGWDRGTRRFESVEGGATTELEFQQLIGGGTRLPVLLVGGFPRSGTTTLQTAVRAAFRPHIPEIDTRRERFSLWEYPKHTPAVFDTVAELSESAVIGLCTVRPFLDAAASLVVGRGGPAKVDVSHELARWEAWLPIYSSRLIKVIPFESVTAWSPAQLTAVLSDLTGVVPSSGVAESASFADLMRTFGKGDPDHPQQSNLPSKARTVELGLARDWVAGELGVAECARLDDVYDGIAFSVSSADGGVESWEAAASGTSGLLR